MLVNMHPLLDHIPYFENNNHPEYEKDIAGDMY
jgi:hypothetical protein